MMMHGTARSAGPPGGAGVGTGYDIDSTGKLIRDVGVNSFITRLGGDPASLAEENNKLQEIGETTRLGIPLTISTDPRNHFQYVLGASVQSGRFSQWPETLGLAAIRDAGLVRRFADIARQEYRAVGIQETLSPQADLATEPRWSRINGTFGEDPELARKLGRGIRRRLSARHEGYRFVRRARRRKTLGGIRRSENGYDSHSSYGRYATFFQRQPDGARRAVPRRLRRARRGRDADVLDSRGSEAERTAARAGGRRLQSTAADGPAAQALRLRRSDTHRLGRHQRLLGSLPQRISCGAASDIRGGGNAVGRRTAVQGRSLRQSDQCGCGPVRRHGGSSVHRSSCSVGEDQRKASGRVGLPHCSTEIQAGIVRESVCRHRGSETHRRQTGVPGGGDARAQQRSLVLLENKKDILPLVARGKRVYLHRIDSAVAARYGFVVVSDLSQADVAIVRTNAPFQTLHPNYVFGAMQHEGALDFRNGDKEFDEIQRIAAAVPTIVTVYLDRPMIMTSTQGSRQRAARELRRERCSAARRVDGSRAAGRQTALRAAVVNGGSRGTTVGCATRHASSIVPHRIWPPLRDSHITEVIGRLDRSRRDLPSAACRTSS